MSGRENESKIRTRIAKKREMTKKKGNQKMRTEKRRKKILIVVMSLLLCFAGTACGGKNAAQADGTATEGQNVLRYGSIDYTAINPALYEHGEINALLFAGLTAHDENNQVVPGLAEKWEFDKKSLTYTFHLREGLTFHDGKPLTSADAKFTLEAILDERNHSEIISNYTDIADIQCPDDLTVKIKLKKENVAFPDYMTIGILPEHLLKDQDLATCDFNQNPVGAGPYKLTEWDMGQTITMERFDNYYGGQPKIEKVIFVIIPNSDTRAMQLKSGEIDMAQITAKTAADFEDNEEITVYQMNTADYRAIAYNFNNSFFKKHKELPEILSYAIDRQAIVDSVLLGEGEIAYSPLQKGEFNDSSINHYDYDPAKAEKLLQEAGWSKNSEGVYEKNGETLTFTIAAMADDQVRVDMAAMCANQLQQIGADVTAKVQPSLDCENQFACIIGWGSPFDPDDHTYKVFSTDAGDNYTGYSDEKVDTLLAKARATDDVATRENLYSQFQKELSQNPAYTFIAYVNADYGIRSKIKGITENTVLGHHGVGVFWNIADWTME